MKYLTKAVLVCLLFAGCADPSTSSGGGSEESGEGISVKWPGGSFEMNKEDGINVRAPGVDVDVEPGKRVDVRAPGVDVDVDVDVEQGEQVDVQAPGVDVHANPSEVDVQVGDKDQ